MKASLLVLTPLFFLHLTDQPKQVKTEKTFYYFCTSHSKYPSMVNGRQVILYTEISKITCEEEDVPKQSKKWNELVQKNCNNENGCTSDLNYFITKEEAEIQFKKMKEYYKDSEKYILKLITSLSSS